MLQVRARSAHCGATVHKLAKARFFGSPQRRCAQRKPFIIGVAGGTASGKTSVCERIIELLQSQPGACGRGVLSISQDCFYNDLTKEQRNSISDYNFDHPSAFNFKEIVSKLRALRDGAAVDIPTYDFVTSSRCSEVTHVEAADVILFDGILAFYNPEVRSLFELKVFVDADADVRLARRLRRDISERGRTVNKVLEQYERTVKPSFENYIAPTKQHADIIIPRGADNIVAIELLWQSIKYRVGETYVPKQEFVL